MVRVHIEFEATESWRAETTVEIDDEKIREWLRSYYQALGWSSDPDKAPINDRVVSVYLAHMAVSEQPWTPQRPPSLGEVDPESVDIVHIRVDTT